MNFYGVFSVKNLGTLKLTSKKFIQNLRTSFVLEMLFDKI